MRFVVTGATGYIGSNLVKKLIDNDHEVLIIVRNTSNLKLLNEIESRVKIFVTTNKIEDLINVLSDFMPNIVCHLASYFVSGHKKEDIANLINSNILFSSQLLEAMKITGIKDFVNVGTSWQNYDGGNYNPVCLYAATKEAFLKILDYYVEVENFRVITLKLYDTYGPGDPRKKIINLFKNIARSGECLDMSEGGQLIDIVYIDDVINSFIEAFKVFNKMKNESRQYYVTSLKPRALCEIAKLFEEVNQVKLNINWGSREYRRREVMVPYIPKNEEIIYETKCSLEEGLKKIYDFDNGGE